MSIRTVCCTALIAFLMVVLLARPAQAVVNGTPVPCNDRRLDCVGLFFTAGSQPGACGGAVSGSCVLVAPDQILIKRHSLNITASQPLSAIGTTRFRARFRRTPTGDAHNSLNFNGTGSACHGVYQEALVARLVDPPIQGSDTVLAFLNKPIVNIRPAPLDINTSIPAGTTVILAGWGHAGECFGGGEHWTLRQARGVLPWVGNGDYFRYTPCIISSSAPCLSCPQGGPWINANLHDSGAGVFIETPSAIPGNPFPELRLLATVATTTSAHRLSAFNRSGGLPVLQQTAPLTTGQVSDFNRDGLVDSKDVFTYFGAYFAGACVADVSGNGATTVEDFFSFIRSYLARN